MAKTTIQIEGMSCQHCVNRVKKALDALTGVTSSDVAIGSATVVFDDARLSEAEIRSAIEKAGYKIKT